MGEVTFKCLCVHVFMPVHVYVGVRVCAYVCRKSTSAVVPDHCALYFLRQGSFIEPLASQKVPGASILTSTLEFQAHEVAKEF